MDCHYSRDAARDPPCRYRPAKADEGDREKDQAECRNNDEVGAVAGSNAGGFDARERNEFAFVEDDSLGTAQKLPPFPGAAGGDQENEGDEQSAILQSR